MNNFLIKNFSEVADNKMGDIYGLSLDDILSSGVKISHIAGTIKSEDLMRFRRMVFRVSKGNALIDFKPMDELQMANFIDPHTVISLFF